MGMNAFAAQQEVLFVTYEDVIKTTKFLILKQLLTDEYRNGYEYALDYSKIDNLTDEQLMGTVFGSTDINILKYLARESFDYDLTYLDLYLNYEDIIKKSKVLTFGESINILLNQKFMDKIYIYTELYDENIHKDIYNLYKSSDVIYTYGNFEEVIEEIHKSKKITTYVLNNIDLVQKLIDLNRVEYTNILVCNAGWNYKLNDRKIPVLKLDDSEILSRQKVFKLAVFNPDPSASYIRN